MYKLKDDKFTKVVPLDQGPEIPNPIPIGATTARCALEILTEDEITQAVARGDAEWQQRLREIEGNNAINKREL